MRSMSRAILTVALIPLIRSEIDECIWVPRILILNRAAPRDTRWSDSHSRCIPLGSPITATSASRRPFSGPATSIPGRARFLVSREDGHQFSGEGAGGLDCRQCVDHGGYRGLHIARSQPEEVPVPQYRIPRIGLPGV